jgi:hypothetical protein
MQAIRKVFLLALLPTLIGCAGPRTLGTLASVPCSPPAELMVPGSKLPPLPARGLTQKEVEKLWAADTASYNSEIGKRNDLIGFVETQCR